jgi:hypothetical protein
MRLDAGFMRVRRPLGGLNAPRGIRSSLTIPRRPSTNRRRIRYGCLQCAQACMDKTHPIILLRSRRDSLSGIEAFGSI